MLGKSLRDQLADKTFEFGTILHHYSDIAEKTKYIVLLNNRWPPPDDVAIYAHCTSKLSHFADRTLMETMIVRLPMGAYDFCTAEETVIDLTNTVERPTAEVVNSRQFRFIGRLNDQHINAIREAVRVSTVISRRAKRRILGTA